MRGTKYLSELVNTEMFQTDKLNVIKAPTGSGKTYFALKTIAGSLPDATHKSVYLIDTVNGQQQICLIVIHIHSPFPVGRRHSPRDG